MRPLILPLLVVLACGKEAPPQPADAPHACAGFAKFMLDTCSVFIVLDACTLSEVTDHPLGAGRVARVDDATWFLALDGSVVSDGREAWALCPSLPDAGDYQRARARKAAEGVPDGARDQCSTADLDVADFVRAELSLWVERVESFSEIPAPAVTEALKRAAENALPKTITPGQAQERWSKVRRICPEAL